MELPLKNWLVPPQLIFLASFRSVHFGQRVIRVIIFNYLIITVEEKLLLTILQNIV